MAIQNKNKSDGNLIDFTVTMDKETKNTYRFQVKSKQGVNGTLYVDKSEYPDIESFKLKARIGDCD